VLEPGKSIADPAEIREVIDVSEAVQMIETASAQFGSW
jgi:hypothetical protein